MKRRTLIAAGFGAALAPGAALARRATFSANAYGAREDAPATRAIQTAIDAAARAGGGTVTLAPGSYVTGALFVKDNVTLRIDRGVTLVGSQDDADYLLLPTRIAGIETVWPAALVNIYRARNAAIVGEGMIDGDGKKWWDAYWKLRAEYEPRGLRWASDYDCRRPRLIQLFEARDARVGDGLMLRRSGFWTLHICYSRDIVVSGVTIRNNEGGRGPSTDGIDIDSSARVLVEHADIACNDDALVVKAGRDFDGLRVARPCEDVVIRDCVVREGAAGITFGSETSGGFRNIKVSRLRVLAPTPTGILFKSARTRGGGGRDIVIEDITMEGMRTAVRADLNWNPSYSYATIPPGITDVPELWRVLATPVPAAQALPHFERVTIRRIRATATRQAFAVAAYPQVTLDHFRFDDIAIDAPDGGTIADARDWRFSNMRLAAKPVVTASNGIVGL